MAIHPGAWRVLGPRFHLRAAVLVGLCSLGERFYHARGRRAPVFLSGLILRLFDTQRGVLERAGLVDIDPARQLAELLDGPKFVYTQRRAPAAPAPAPEPSEKEPYAKD